MCLAVIVCLVVLVPAWLAKPGRLSAACVLILSGLAGGLSHHQMWWSVPADDISWWLQPQPALMKIRGHVAERPKRLAARREAHPGVIPRSDQVRFSLDCDSLEVPDHTVRVSGRLRVDVTAQDLDLSQGDAVTVLGEVVESPASRNPGEFDIASAFKARGIRGVMRVGRPELITVSGTSVNPVTGFTDWLRSRCEVALDHSLSERSRSIAAALLLGDRSLISHDVRLSFMESGTMHLLAVSGLHIGILTAFLFACCRFVGFSDRGAVILVLILLAVYLGVAEVRPPVLRACVLAGFWGTGRLLRRTPLSANSLAGAAIVVLTLNPSDLFNVGAQLSFLAVAILLHAIAGRGKREPVAGDALRPLWQQRLLPAFRWLWEAYRTTGLIWLLTMPLVASAFNIVSPAGLVVNVLLIPLTGVALCAGLISLGLGVVHPWLGVLPGAVSDAVLCGLLQAVEVSAQIPLGHFHVPPPPVWWLIGLYALVAVAMLSVAWRRARRLRWSGVLLWILFGVSLAVQPAVRTGLRCTFLSVGHGLSVLIETPSGRTLLYDAGSLSSGDSVARVVERVLWIRGHRQIDCLVISHADIDHYNGAVPLFDVFPIRSVLHSHHFPDAAQPGTMEILQRARQSGTVLRQVEAGDHIAIDSDVVIRVLHPEAHGDYSSDNAGSVILEVAYAGRSILLTGDVENEGLWRLLARPVRKQDVLLAPHHGSLAANPRSLADWSQPDWIVVSAGRGFPGRRLREQYGVYGGRVLSTFEAGAITCEISPDGHMTSKSWKKPATAGR